VSDRPIRILELRSVWGTGGGPEKTILLGTARTDPTRFAVTVCYLRDRRDPVFSIDAKAADLPIEYIELVEAHSFDPGIFTKLRRTVRERAIDIVHSHDYKTNVLAWLLAKFEPVVPLSTVHGWTGHSQRERWVYYPLDKRVLTRFPTAIAVSSDVRNELLNHGAHPDNVRVVLNGIDPVMFRRDRSRGPAVRRALGLQDSDVVIGAVGRLEPQKRFDLLIDAFAALRSHRANAHLVIAGDGSLRTDLNAHAERLSLSDSCHLLGHRTDIADIHHAFDLFVQSSDYEGTPNAVLEAMALESPTIATNAGGTEEILRDGIDGVIIGKGSVRVLQDAIESALAEPRATRERASSARRRIETVLSYEARMRAVEAIYLELFERRRNLPSKLAPARL
jgi:glycosyltransferase involved in cell wall biosynthesis